MADFHVLRDPGEPTLSRAQDAISEALRAGAPVPGSSPEAGRLLTGLALSTTPLDVAHALGRAPRGWRTEEMTSPSAALTVYREASPNEAQFLRLRTTNGTCTVNVWVW